MSIRKKIVMGLLVLGVIGGFGSGIARLAHGRHSSCDRGGEGRWGDGHGWGGRWNRDEAYGHRNIAPVAPVAPAAPVAAAPAPQYVPYPMPFAVPQYAPAPAPAQQVQYIPVPAAAPAAPAAIAAPAPAEE